MIQARHARRHWPWGLWETVFGSWVALIIVVAVLEIVLAPR
jgi:hypothetical protein